MNSLLILEVFRWDKAAIERQAPARVRRGLWRIIDALYGDCELYRSPAFLAEVEKALNAMRDNETTDEIRKELGILPRPTEEEIDAPLWAGSENGK